MSNSQKQNLKNSTAIQAGRDVNVGLSYRDVKNIVYDLFRQNFPALVNEATINANENIKNYIEQLDIALRKKIKEIDLNKFKDPNTQFLLNNTISQAARKGKSIDLGLLTETLITTLNKANNAMLDIVSEQALEILPKVTSSHISILTLMQFLIHMRLENLSSIKGIEPHSVEVINLTSNISANTYSQLTYLASLGVLTINQLQGINPYDAIKSQYKYLYDSNNSDEIKNDITKNAPNLSLLIDIYIKKKLEIVNLTPVGMLIALINMRRIFKNIDYKIWIK